MEILVKEIAEVRDHVAVGKEGHMYAIIGYVWWRWFSDWVVGHGEEKLIESQNSVYELLSWTGQGDFQTLNGI